jgi:hypothetical protein
MLALNPSTGVNGVEAPVNGSEASEDKARVPINEVEAPDDEATAPDNKAVAPKDGVEVLEVSAAAIEPGIKGHVLTLKHFIDSHAVGIL